MQYLAISNKSSLHDQHFCYYNNSLLQTENKKIHENKKYHKKDALS